jgi:hypothetical protein
MPGLCREDSLPNVKLEGAQVDQASDVARTGEPVADGDASVGMRADDSGPVDVLDRPPEDVSIAMHVPQPVRVRTGARKLEGANVDARQLVDQRLPAPPSVPGPMY